MQGLRIEKAKTTTSDHMQSNTLVCCDSSGSCGKCPIAMHRCGICRIQFDTSIIKDNIVDKPRIIVQSSVKKTLKIMFGNDV